MTFAVIAILYCLGVIMRVYGLNRTALFVLIVLAVLEVYGHEINQKKKGGRR